MKLNDLKNKCEKVVVLYVEDDNSVRSSISEILRNIFENVIVAADGEEGFKKFNDNKEIIDIVITDIEMPHKDGIEMSTQIREIDSEISILVISAYNDSEYFLKMIKLGIDGYLIKPLEMQQFVNTLFKVIQKILLKKQNYQYQYHLEQEVSKKTEELKLKYYIDDLTKIKNRYALLEDIQQYKTSKLILVDINKFSVLNNLYGSKYGDDILKSITSKLKSIIPQGNNLYRVSADQFVFLPNREQCSTDYYNLVNLITTTLNETTFKLTIDDDIIDVNITVTIAKVDNVQRDKILECADIALHYAKKTNKTFVLYSKDLINLMNHKKTIDAIKLVKNALQDDRLIPHFQPIVKKDSISYECLVRIIDLSGNIILPFIFVDEIKNTPYYIQLTKTMIDKSFEYFNTKKKSFSINLSFEDIVNQYIVNHLKKQLNKYQLHKYLILEILESELIDNFNIVKTFIREMKDLGVRIAIDDFGSGYSNFSYLLELEPDFIKIDGSIIKHIATDKKSYIIAKTIVNFSKELGIKTIAEFIHTKEVLKVVEELQIDGKQGYLLGEPHFII